MKTVFLGVLVLLVVSNTGFAQADQQTINKEELYLRADMLMEANFGLNHGKNQNEVNGTIVNEYSTFNTWGSTKFGYFLADRLALGLGINVDAEYEDLQSGDENTRVDLFGGPFIRWYFIDKLHLQVFGGYGIQNVKLESGTTVTNINYNGIFAGGGLGYDIFLNENGDVALQIGANYNYKNLKRVDVDTDKLIMGKFNYHLGIVFYFF